MLRSLNRRRAVWKKGVIRRFFSSFVSLQASRVSAAGNLSGSLAYLAPGMRLPDFEARYSWAGRWRCFSWTSSWKKGRAAEDGPAANDGVK